MALFASVGDLSTDVKLRTAMVGKVEGLLFVGAAMGSWAYGQFSTASSCNHTLALGTATGLMLVAALWSLCLTETLTKANRRPWQVGGCSPAHQSVRARLVFG